MEVVEGLEEFHHVTSRWRKFRPSLFLSLSDFSFDAKARSNVDSGKEFKRRRARVLSNARVNIFAHAGGFTAEFIVSRLKKQSKLACTTVQADATASGVRPGSDCFCHCPNILKYLRHWTSQPTELRERPFFYAHSAGYVRYIGNLNIASLR